MNIRTPCLFDQREKSLALNGDIFRYRSTAAGHRCAQPQPWHCHEWGRLHTKLPCATGEPEDVNQRDDFKGESVGWW